MATKINQKNIKIDLGEVDFGAGPVMQNELATANQSIEGLPDQAQTNLVAQSLSEIHQRIKDIKYSYSVDRRNVTIPFKNNYREVASFNIYRPANNNFECMADGSIYISNCKGRTAASDALTIWKKEKSWQYRIYYPDIGSIRSMQLLSDEKLLLTGNQGGLSILSKDSKDNLIEMPINVDDHVNHVSVISENELFYIGDRQQLYRLQKDKKSVWKKQYIGKFGDLEGKIRALNTNDEYSLMFLNISSLVLVKIKDNQCSTDIISVVEKVNNNLQILPEGDILYREGWSRDDRLKLIKNFADPNLRTSIVLYSDSVSAFQKLMDGRLIIGKQNGELFIVNQDGSLSEELSNGTPDHCRISQIHARVDGSILTVYDDGRVLIWDGELANG